MAFELIGGPEICFPGFPYVLYMTFRAGIAFSDFVDETSSAGGYLQTRSYMTTWFEDGNGLNRLNATTSHFSMELCVNVMVLLLFCQQMVCD